MIDLQSEGYHPEEIEFFHTALKAFRPDFICEWGTNIGHSARVFAELVRMLGLSCQVHSVDVTDDIRFPGYAFHALDHKVSLHIGDGVTVGVDLYLKTKCQRPLFFLDDDHVESEVLRQLVTISEEVPHAVMIVHDVFTARLIDGQTVSVYHEPGFAIERFKLRNDRYEITTGESMMMLWPK